METSRRLPHIYPKDRWLFVTFHLHGSLPHGVYPPAEKLTAGQAFMWIDRRLDRATSGPLYLKQAPIARVVIESLFKGVDVEHYALGAFAVMANHVHALLRPFVPPSLLLKSLKGVTAREANKILGRTGEQFWQREAYDHWVRDETEWSRIAADIEDNPVKAGLAASAHEYPWSSANAQWSSLLAGERVHMSVNAARMSACATSTTDAFSPTD